MQAVNKNNNNNGGSLNYYSALCPISSTRTITDYQPNITDYSKYLIGTGITYLLSL